MNAEGKTEGAVSVKENEIVTPKVSNESGPESGIHSNSSEHSNSVNASGEESDEDKTIENDPASNSDVPVLGLSSEEANSSEGENATENTHQKSSPEKSNSRRSILKPIERKRNVRNIRFGSIREYLFNRKQSFCTLPSTGGCALGMDGGHHDTATIPLPVHRERLYSKRRKKLRHWRQKQRKLSNGEKSSQETTDDLSSSCCSDSDSDAPEEDLSGVDDWWFLQPIAPKKRRKILKKYAKEVDSNDRQNNRELRGSREVCGCSCFGICDPEKCECAVGGIPCQVDRDGFPCGCQPGRCGNASGRRSFNSARVRHHFFKTMYRLRLQEQGQEPSLTPPTQPEVPMDEPQQPFSFGDFTRPSDFQGTIYWPQQWNQQGNSVQSVSQWNGLPQNSAAESLTPSRLCESRPGQNESMPGPGDSVHCDEQAILKSSSTVEQSSESSTEDSSSVDIPIEESPQVSQHLKSLPEEHETNITVVNEDSIGDSDNVSI